jgi:hypothetical protein
MKVPGNGDEVKGESEREKIARIIEWEIRMGIFTLAKKGRKKRNEPELFFCTDGQRDVPPLMAHSLLKPSGRPPKPYRG